MMKVSLTHLNSGASMLKRTSTTLYTKSIGYYLKPNSHFVIINTLKAKSKQTDTVNIIKNEKALEKSNVLNITPVTLLVGAGLLTYFIDVNSVMAAVTTTENYKCI